MCKRDVNKQTNTQKKEWTGLGLHFWMFKHTNGKSEREIEFDLDEKKVSSKWEKTIAEQEGLSTLAEKYTSDVNKRAVVHAQF